MGCGGNDDIYPYVIPYTIDGACLTLWKENTVELEYEVPHNRKTLDQVDYLPGFTKVDDEKRGVEVNCWSWTSTKVWNGGVVEVS
jgi:hypothetical protein